MSRRALPCDVHGAIAWGGEVICVACSRVWKLLGSRTLDAPPTECGKNCVCGVPLGGPEGSARPICSFCYVERKKVERARVN